MSFNNKGIQESDFVETTENGTESSPQKFATEIISRNLRNSVFVDSFR